MKSLEVCFVGIGSIAKRHIKNLKVIANKRNIDLKIDAIRRTEHRDCEIDKLGIRNVFTSHEQLNSVYDVVFITNPTILHLDSMNNLKEYGKMFFVEKPLVTYEQMESVQNLIEKNKSSYYVACPLRYNSVIQYIKQNIEKEKVLSVRSISSSYLPEWRTGTDYRDTYSARSELGGGVSIDLIHEWDYLTYLFGEPNSVKKIVTKKSNLQINSDDIAVYIAEYTDKIVELHLDYFGRSTIREVMLFTQDDTIVGDIANSKIKFLKTGKVIDFGEDRDVFQIRELEHFLDIVEGKCVNDNDAAHAISVLRLSR